MWDCDKFITYKNTVFNHCNFRLPQQQLKLFKWQTIVTPLWKSLFRKTRPVQCTFVHKKQFYGLVHTKVRCPVQVTRQRQGWNAFKLFFFLRHSIPGHKTAFHRLIQQLKVLWGTSRGAKVSLINYIHRKIEENTF